MTVDLADVAILFVAYVFTCGFILWIASKILP
jgi:hypothetical protein